MKPIKPPKEPRRKRVYLREPPSITDAEARDRLTAEWAGMPATHADYTAEQLLDDLDLIADQYRTVIDACTRVLDRCQESRAMPEWVKYDVAELLAYIPKEGQINYESRF